MIPVPTQNNPQQEFRHNWPDRALFYGIDNLAVLQGMNSENVDLIIMDPPFKNNGEVYHGSGTAEAAAFHDYWTWREHVHESWWEGIRDNWRGVYAVVDAIRYAVNSDMAAYAAAMAARFMECHRILKRTGSIYIHCDPDVSPYWRMLLDAVFGSDNFQREIVWKRSSAHNDSGQGARRHGAIHDSLLFYTKTNSHTWNPVFTEYDASYIENFYKFVEEGTGRRYRLDNLTARRTSDQPSLRYELMGITPHPNRVWAYGYENMMKLVAEGRVIQTKPGNVPVYKRYLDEMPGVVLQDIWADINPLSSGSRERTGWPTQKPAVLYERIVETSSNEGDVVLDPFCGSGTALVAADNLNRRWVGIDLDLEAEPIIRARLENIRLNSSPPVRTDDRRNAWDEPDWEGLTPMKIDPKTIVQNSRERKNIIAGMYGLFCAGCGFSPPVDWSEDDRLEYLEVDHDTPRTGKEYDNQLGNLMLLCGPCNGRKSDKLTYDELITKNVQEGRMKAPEGKIRGMHAYRKQELDRWGWKFGNGKKTKQRGSGSRG